MHFPLFVNLENKNIIIFGAGKIALRRVNTLINTKANITIIAPNVLEEFYYIDNIKIVKDTYNKKYLKEAFIVLAITNDKSVNDKIYLDCKEKNVIVNIASDKEKCDFFFPGVIYKKDYTIGICGNGTNHSLVKNTIDKIRNFLNKKE